MCQIKGGRRRGVDRHCHTFRPSAAACVRSRFSASCNPAALHCQQHALAIKRHRSISLDDTSALGSTVCSNRPVPPHHQPAPPPISHIAAGPIARLAAYAAYPASTFHRHLIRGSAPAQPASLTPTSRSPRLCHREQPRSRGASCGPPTHTGEGRRQSAARKRGQRSMSNSRTPTAVAQRRIQVSGVGAAGRRDCGAGGAPARRSAAGAAAAWCAWHRFTRATFFHQRRVSCVTGCSTHQMAAAWCRCVGARGRGRPGPAPSAGKQSTPGQTSVATQRHPACIC